MIAFRSVGVWLLVTTVHATAAAAQGPAPSPAPPPVPTSGWSNGFFLQSPNGEYRLQLGAVVQVDGRFSLDEGSPATDTFTIRKARPILAGRLARFFDYRLMSEFGNGQASVLDAYVETRFSPAFRVRAGKDKTPVGYELLLGDATLWFPERSLATSLMPNRDVGLQVIGETAGGRLVYSAGLFNGIPDGTSSTADTDSNDGKDVAGRVWLQPFRSATGGNGLLNGLGVQIGGSTGDQRGALPTFRTSSGGQVYFSYAGASGSTPAAQAAGSRRRITPALFYFRRSVGLFAEFTESRQTIARGAVTRDIVNRGWDVTGSWLLTGETASTAVPNPRRPFDPTAGTWGAIQLVARHAVLAVDREAFESGLAAAGSSRLARATTLGLNWYPAQVIKYYVTYERSSFDGPTARPVEHTFLLRIQLAF